MDVVDEPEAPFAGMPVEMHAVLALGHSQLEPSLNGLRRLLRIFGYSLISPGVHASLRAAIVHPKLIILINDVRGEDMLIIEFSLFAQ